MPRQSKVEKRGRLNWFSLVLTEYSVCNLGHYAVLAILSLFLVQSLDLPTAQAGVLMLFASLSFRLSRIFTAPLVDRLPLRQAALLALFLTSLGYLGMSVARSLLLVTPLLLVVGVGHGTNTLVVKTMIAHFSSSNQSQKAGKSLLLRYASLSTGTNVSAAVGSVVGVALLLHWSASSVFLLAAIMYGLSGLIAMLLPSQHLSESRHLKWGTGLRMSLRLPTLWRVMLSTFLGWSLYTQSYSSLPLFVNSGVHRPDLLGSIFALNAMLVVVGQLPLSKVIVRLGVRTSQLMLLAFLSFAGGFALLYCFPIWQTIYGAMTLWTLGEMLLLPTLDTLVAEGALFENKQVAFTLNSVAVSLGEGFGNLVGISVAGWLLRYGDLRNLYALLALWAMGAMIVTMLTGNRRGSMIHRLLRGRLFLSTDSTELLLPIWTSIKREWVSSRSTQLLSVTDSRSRDGRFSQKSGESTRAHNVLPLYFSEVSARGRIPGGAKKAVLSPYEPNGFKGVVQLATSNDSVLTNKICCKNCHAILPSHANFCGVCGAKLEKLSKSLDMVLTRNSNSQRI